MLVIRRGQSSDVDGIARVHADTGRDAYRDFLPVDALLTPERLARRLDTWREVLDRLGDQTSTCVEGLWVAVDTDAPHEVLGFVYADRSNDPDADETSGEIVCLYVTTNRQGEGLGDRLLRTSIDHLAAQGCEDLRLWTLEGNARAQRFYGKRAWTADGEAQPVRTGEYEATEVRFRTDRPALEALPISRSALPMLDTLLAQPLDEGRYLADAPGWFGPRVFGGAVVAQVVTAAALAAGDAGRAHSLHTHFLRAVYPGSVELQVEPIRTGRTFTTLRVDSVQDGRPAATSVVSFHADEDEVPYQLPMPDVPAPDACPVIDDAPPPFEVRWIGPTEQRDDGTYASTRRCWIKTADDLPDDPLAVLLVLTFLSDMTGTSFRPHNLGEWGTHTDASIDHAVWFHRPVRADCWLYCDYHALVNAGGRSTVRGEFYDEAGNLCLSMAQELLIRPLA